MAVDPLVTLEQAKAHLRVRHTEEDDDIEQKMTQATEIILDYLKDRADDTWTEDDTPGPVQAAILKELAHLWKFRGDQDVAGLRQGADEDYDGLAPGVKGLLKRYRDMTIA